MVSSKGSVYIQKVYIYVDSRYKKFISHNTPNRINIVFCYVVKDHHLHPILSKDLKQAACEANQKGARNY